MSCVIKKKFISLWSKLNSKLLYKMFIVYSLLTVIPLAIVSGTSYYRSKNIIQSKINDASRYAPVHNGTLFEVF